MFSDQYREAKVGTAIIGKHSPLAGADAASLSSALLPADIERRRPGRVENVNPHMIPLLRDTATVDIAENHVDIRRHFPHEDGLTAVKGIVFAVAVCIPFWALLGTLIWF